MNSLVALNLQLSKGEFLPYYIFIGEETTIMKTYINKIAQLSCANSVTYIDSLNEVFTKTASNLFSNDVVYVVFEDKDVLTTEKLQQRLLSYNRKMPIILIYLTMDKRLSFYKKFEERITWFPLLETQQLVPIIKQHVAFENDKAYKDIINVCDNNYGRILLEIDKINKYSALKNTTKVSAFYELLASGVISASPENELLSFVDYVMNRNINKVLGMLPHMDINENIKTLTYLYNSIRTYFLVQSYKGDKSKITQEIGLSWAILKNIVSSRKAYSVDELERALHLIRNTINNIKQGLIDNNIALYYVIFKIL